MKVFRLNIINEDFSELQEKLFNIKIYWSNVGKYSHSSKYGDYIYIFKPTDTCFHGKNCDAVFAFVHHESGIMDHYKCDYDYIDFKSFKDFEEKHKWLFESSKMDLI